MYGTSALNFREASRYERPSGHPPGRFGDHHSSDIPQRRARESDNMDLEGPKRRRLNDDAEPSRHVSVDLPLSLPAKPPSLPSEPSQVDTQRTHPSPPILVGSAILTASSVRTNLVSQIPGDPFLHRTHNGRRMPCVTHCRLQHLTFEAHHPPVWTVCKHRLPSLP